MEAYTYSNLFDTKGIEYIIIIFFLLLLIPIWIVVSRKSEVVRQIRQKVSVLTAGILRIPQGLFFSRNHTWLYLEKSGQARIGIDDFLAHIVGNVQVTSLKSPGDKIKKGEVVAVLEQNGKQLRVHSPVSGEMAEVNTVIAENGEMLISDPYNEGWLFSVKPDNWKGETTGFYLAEEASKWINSELQRMKDFLSIALAKHAGASPAIVFQEGGELQANPLEELEADIWNDFQKEFLDERN